VALGAWLRWRGLAWQIPFDDEWHALDFALTRDLPFLFTHYSRLGANSVPQNLYLRALLMTWGWTEISIVLPSVLAGVGLVWFFPRWIARRFGAEAALVAAVLLSVAPFLIFYSRFARPYAPALLLQCLALTNLSDWLHTARFRHALAAAIFGALAIWTHLTMVAPIVAALAAAVALRWLERRRAPWATAPSAGKVLLVALATGAFTAALGLPSFLNAMGTPSLDSARFSLSTVTGLLRLWGGTTSIAALVVYFGLALAGAVLAARSAKRDLLLVAAAAIGAVGAVLVLRPLQAEVPAICARYALPLFLLSPLAIGVAVQAGVRASNERIRTLVLGAAILVLGAAFYYSGPLPRIHARQVSSFTRHPAFQYDYSAYPADRSRPDPVTGQQLPVTVASLDPFYARLAAEGGDAPIIEYPFILGQDGNLHYFAQRQHGRRVLAGYWASGMNWDDRWGLALGDHSVSAPAEASRGYIQNDMTLDQVLGRPGHGGQVRFATVVDLADPPALEASGAQYVVLHRDLFRELYRRRLIRGPDGDQFFTRIRELLAGSRGEPVWEDSQITVFRLR
jgi:predicted membrane-bound mannosyltransferase